ncbi:potassium channel family protein [Halopiger goleimassiliensis]|uniref:potassium channel family protein n=1 Tax=Halopiger goleimassiliensis TaxID=1293048 RepID=UPI001E2DD25B|nr:NAD-binding protein [Halopiger goleimassiliensis]
MSVVRLGYRLAAYLGSLVLLTGLYASLYSWGMATLEGDPRPWYQSFEVVVQSMTTTGYGQDAPWETLEMTALMVAIQLTGIAYIFVAVPLFVVPWLDRIVQATPPADVAELAGHVVIVGYTPLCKSLVDELESAGTEYVVLEPDEERAQSLHEDGLVVLHGDPAADATLENAQVGEALAVVVDASEGEHISAVIELAARTDGPRVLTLVADPSRARYLRYAGADEVISPKHRLGKALGDKVRPVVDTDLEGAIDLDGELQLREFPIEPDSPLHDRDLSAATRVEADGATVLGAWVRGDFLRSLPGEVHVDDNTTLLVAGTDGDFGPVVEATDSEGSPYRPLQEPVVVVGTGTVGSSAAGDLERAGIERTVLDRENGELVDAVGDVTTEEGLAAADVGAAGTVILALDDDETALLATLVARELNPDLEIFAAADVAANVHRLRDAGADYSLGLPNVAGRMLALRIFEREAMTFGDRIELRLVDVPNSAGKQLDSAAIRALTGCSVVALERDGELETAVGGRELSPGDRLLVAGTEDELEGFHAAFDSRPA